MITFKSASDLSKLPPTDPAFPLVKDLVDRLITDDTWEGIMHLGPIGIQSTWVYK